MDGPCDALRARLHEADRFGRFRAYVPHTAGGRVVIVHSKLAIFDDHLMRVGSTNLNNRSLGYDTECDLAIEAAKGTAGEHIREAISWLICDVVGHYLGYQTDTVMRAVQDMGGVAATIDALDRSARRRLCPLTPTGGRWCSLPAK